MLDVFDVSNEAGVDVRFAVTPSSPKRGAETPTRALVGASRALFVRVM